MGAPTAACAAPLGNSVKGSNVPPSRSRRRCEGEAAGLQEAEALSTGCLLRPTPAHVRLTDAGRWGRTVCGGVSCTAPLMSKFMVKTLFLYAQKSATRPGLLPLSVDAQSATLWIPACGAFPTPRSNTSQGKLRR